MMIKMRNYLLILYIATCSCLRRCDGFFVTPVGGLLPCVTTTTTTTSDVKNRQTLPVQSSSGTQLFLANDNNNTLSKKKVNDGTQGRGLILFGLVLALNVWMFSLPASFRRRNVCNDDVYQRIVVDSGVKPNDDRYCITMEMWKQSIVDYYKNGGGVEFDLSIDPKTLERNKMLWESTFGGSQ